jgi:hypothetical protein
MTLPVVAKKPLRVEERGSNLSDMGFLIVEWWSAISGTLYAGCRVCKPGKQSHARKRRKNQNRPVSGGLASWVETPLFQAGGGHFYEDVGATFSPIEEKRNNAKILETGARITH